MNKVNISTRLDTNFRRQNKYTDLSVGLMEEERVAHLKRIEARYSLLRHRAESCARLVCVSRMRPVFAAPPGKCGRQSRSYRRRDRTLPASCISYCFC